MSSPWKGEAQPLDQARVLCCAPDHYWLSSLVRFFSSLRSSLAQTPAFTDSTRSYVAWQAARSLTLTPLVSGFSPPTQPHPLDRLGRGKLPQTSAAAVSGADHRLFGWLPGAANPFDSGAGQFPLSRRSYFPTAFDQSRTRARASRHDCPASSASVINCATALSVATSGAVGSGLHVR